MYLPIYQSFLFEISQKNDNFNAIFKPNFGIGNMLEMSEKAKFILFFIINTYISCLYAHEAHIFVNRSPLAYEHQDPHPRPILLDKDWEYRKSGQEHWFRADLPFTLNEQDVFLFRKLFVIDSTNIADGYILSIPGVNGVCSVYLNKKLLDRHYAGNTPFSLHLKKEDVFSNEKNELLIEWDNRTDYHTTIPLVVRNRGIPIIDNCLIRPIQLLPLGSIYIDQLTITYDDSILTNSPLMVRLQLKSTLQWLDVLSAINDLTWQIQIFEAGNAKTPIFRSPLLPASVIDVGQQKDAIELTTRFSIENIRFWRIRAPQLYRIEAQIMRKNDLIEQMTFEVGFSKNEFLRKENETPIFLQVIEWIADPRILQLPEDDFRKQIEEDLQNIYLLGADAVRLPAGSPSDYFLTVCDRLGLLVMLDLPISNFPPAILTQEPIPSKARSALIEQIEAFKAHPCLGAWGLGSGYNIADSRTKNFIQMLYTIGAAIDDRPFYIGVRGAHQYDSWNLAIYRLHEIWLDDALRQLPQLQRIRSGDMVQLITPLAAWEDHTDAAQRIQASNLKTMLLEARQTKRLSAVIVADFRDFIGDHPYLYWGPVSATRQQRTGLLDLDNIKRPSFDIVKAIYNHTVIPEIIPIGFVPQSTSIFQIIGLGLFFLLLLFLKRDKRFANYLKRVFLHPHGFYIDLYENRQVNPFPTGLMGFMVITTVAAILTSFIFYFRQNIYFDELLTWVLNDAEVKDRAIRIIWDPLSTLWFMMLVLTVVAVLQAVIIKLIVLLQRRRLRFYQAIAFVFWVPANFIFAIPLVIVLFRILERESLLSFILGYLALLLLWFFGRALRGLKEILQMSMIRALLLQITIIGLIILLVGLYLEHTRALLAYIEYYRGLIGL